MMNTGTAGGGGTVLLKKIINLLRIENLNLFLVYFEEEGLRYSQKFVKLEMDKVL